MRGVVTRNESGDIEAIDTIDSTDAEPAVRGEYDEQSGVYFGGECERCRFTAFDVMQRGDWRWLVACIYCGMRAEVPPVIEPEPPAGVGKSKADTMKKAPESLTGLRFREGRHAGKTLKEIAETIEGAEYLEWYAKAGKSKFMRERVAEFITLLDD